MMTPRNVAPGINRPGVRKIAETIARLDVDPMTRLKIVRDFRRTLIQFNQPAFNPRLFSTLATMDSSHDKPSRKAR